MISTPSSSSSELNQILLSSDLTALIVIDHQVAFKLCFDAEDVKSAEYGVAELVDVSDKIGIPVITSLIKPNLIGSKLSARLESKLPRLTHLNRNSINPWDDPEFAKAVQTANRSCLVIAGLSAESSLSLHLAHLQEALTFLLSKMRA